MKRRKFVTAGVFFAALLAAALAAASVGSAATAKTMKGTPLKVHGTPLHSVGQATFKPASTGGQLQSQTLAQIEAAGKLVAHANRPTRGGPAGAGHAPVAGPSLPTPIPHIHSTPVVGKGTWDASAQGLNEFWQEIAHGGPLVGDLTPPDQALAEGNGYVLEVVNDMLVVMDTNLRHPFGLMRLEDLMFPAIAFTNESNVGDPRAYYDTTYNRWIISTYAFDPATGNSAIDIAVSLTGNPAGAYNIYFIDVTNDGTDCTGGFGCFGDQPLFGADNNALVWTTNSFNNLSGVFNGVQMYVVDKAALMGGSSIPTIWYGDVGGSYDYPGYTGPANPINGNFNTCGAPNPNPSTGYCFASWQPATSPNGSYNPHFGGTEFGMASLDPLAGQDNRLIQWFLTGTVGVSFSPPSLFWYVMGSESYGYPYTNSCMVMPQMGAFGVSPIQCGYAEQPAGGNLPFCDFFYFGPGCEPGGIQADDDRMNAVISITGAQGATVILGGLNTDALISDPLGVLHRHDAVAWFAAQGFYGVFGQGYIGNWQNDILYPTVVATVSSGGTHAVAALDVTGNNTLPSFALAKFNIHSNASQVTIGVPGQDVLDDFCTDVPVCGNPFPPPFVYRPRYGDYSAAVADGNNIYTAGEYAGSSCDEATYENTFFQCNPATAPVTPVGFPTPRGFASNWATGILKTHT